MEGLTMDEKWFDNIARRVGGLRSRRDALKAAGGVAAAAFAALGLENSALAQVSTQDHCQVRGGTCITKRECCGWRRRSREIVCRPITGLSGDRCCGTDTARCTDDLDCCELFECNLTTLRCQRT
jgi:hypothetical protein